MYWIINFKFQRTNKTTFFYTTNLSEHRPFYRVLILVVSFSLVLRTLD